MLFDSENIPLSTRIEAKKGINVTYNVNSDNEGVWSATLDSDYLVSSINTILGTSLNDVPLLLNKIHDFEELLGLFNNAVNNIVVSSDSDTFNYIDLNMVGSTLTSDLKIKWKLISFDGDTLISKDMVFATGSTRLNILNALSFSLKNDQSVSSYATGFRFDDGTKIHWKWLQGFERMLFNVEVLQTSDSVKFTINQ